MPRSLSGFDADSRALCQGPLSRQAEYPVASVLQLEAGSDGSRCRCPSAGLVEGKELCLSPVLPDHEGTGEVAGIRRGTDTSHAVVVHTVLVSHSPGYVSVVTGSSTHEQQSPKGVLNLRPAMPRYQQSWNVDTVLTYLQTLPNNEDLSLRSVTQKLAVLLAITAPKRSSELKLLDLRFMRILR